LKERTRRRSKPKRPNERTAAHAHTNVFSYLQSCDVFFPCAWFVGWFGLAGRTCAVGRGWRPCSPPSIRLCARSAVLCPLACRLPTLGSNSDLPTSISLLVRQVGSFTSTCESSAPVGVFNMVFKFINHVGHVDRDFTSWPCRASRWPSRPSSPSAARHRSNPRPAHRRASSRRRRPPGTWRCRRTSS